MGTVRLSARNLNAMGIVFSREERIYSTKEGVVSSEDIVVQCIGKKSKTFWKDMESKMNVFVFAKILFCN